MINRNFKNPVTKWRPLLNEYFTLIHPTRLSHKGRQVPKYGQVDGIKIYQVVFYPMARQASRTERSDCFVCTRSSYKALFHHMWLLRLNWFLENIELNHHS